MKKTLLTILVCFAASATAFAQLNIGFGYYGELHDSKETKDAKHDYYDMHGAYVGLSYNFCFTGDAGFGLAPGAYFAFSGDIENDIFTRHTSVEIPVHLTYSLEAGPGLFFAYAGPAFNVGINFKEKWVGDGASTDARIDWYKKKEAGPLTISRYDLKVGLGVGYSWEHLMFNLGWDFGTLNRYTKAYKELSPSCSYRLHNFHVGMAYVF